MPRSVPGLVTQRLLVMDFLDGTPITRLGQRTQHLSRRRAVPLRTLKSLDPLLVLVMGFLYGTPITRLGQRMRHLSLRRAAPFTP